MSKTNAISGQPESLRERKRRETHDRLVKNGLKLFMEKGFEATTLDAIAAAAGISRRTFFYYFKSKEDILLAQEGSGFSQALRTAMLEESTDQTPIKAARQCLIKLASRYESQQSIVVDRLLRSTEALRARKEALFADMEQTLYEAMTELWPQQVERDVLRLAAMMAIGTLRLALDQWRAEEARHRLEDYLLRYFTYLEGCL
ncbi:TetR/AcrR family transcriptional regulator [Thalassospira marina]|nr:TetR/AcrR family transcriptional regulator [Thalassospira marina]